MSPRGEVLWRGAATLLVVATLLAGRAWDRPATSAHTGSETMLDPCPAGGGVAADAGSDSFVMGGLVVRSERWCGVAEVRVTADAVAGTAGPLRLVAATSRGSATLEASMGFEARLPVGSDGWVAVALVQAPAGALEGGGVWVTVNAGATSP